MVTDPHHFNADSDPASYLNADSDPAFHFNADPDPLPDSAPYQVMRICHHCLQNRQGFILSLQASNVSVHGPPRLDF